MFGRIEQRGVLFRAFEREGLAGMAVLGASGMLSAIALILLASNRIPGLPAILVTPLLLAIQWQIAGLTLAKFGTDFAIFAIVSQNQGLAYNALAGLRFPVLPATGVFWALCVPMFGWAGATYLAISVVADALSTFLQAELNARKRYLQSATGNVFNYPLFVICLAFLAGTITMTLEIALSLFAITSALRLCWNFYSVRSQFTSSNGQVFQLNSQFRIAAQGLLNMALFRTDQLAIALLVFLFDAGDALPLLSAYLFLARCPEFGNGVLNLIGTVLFPKFHVQAQCRGESARLNRVLYGWLLLALMVLTIAALFVLIPFFDGPAISFALALPFALQVPLALLANLASYSMQTHGYLPGLLRNYLLACLAGGVVLAFALHFMSIIVMAWIVPVQLFTSFVLFLAFSWGHPIRLYDIKSAH
jgi:hypothetical protein